MQVHVYLVQITDELYMEPKSHEILFDSKKLPNNALMPQILIVLIRLYNEYNRVQWCHSIG